MAARRLVYFLLFISSCAAHAREDIHVAVASSLRGPFTELVSSFAAQHPEYRVQVTYAATGKLVAQVQNGAPYHLLIAADPHYLATLYQRDLLAEAPRTFAQGAIVLWHPEQSGTLQQLLSQARHIGIAQPRHAPYGQAAVSFLEQQGWLVTSKPRFIYAENAAQVVHRVYAGAVPMGFVALSQIHELGVNAADYSVLPSAPLLAHTTALTRKSATHSGAQLLQAMLWQKEGQQLLARFGYQVTPVDGEPSHVASE
ncbi:molybdate ABC transporter substrate-binding protein [Pseudidiomarina salilacus]|uniref:molybdate ABC transporter substrate-binding protein n=1 Tax=Pseudidiomarina salilacus TaxID=3384452 RepID=UPI003984ED68